MYYFIVTTLMLFLPGLCVTVDALHRGIPVVAESIGKWYVFWGVGVRLLLAGLRQVTQPVYTARVILGLKTDETFFLVRELGFANISIGVVATLSLELPSWRPAAAVAGASFYALAGFSHAFQSRRNRLQTVAMISDLFAAIVLLGVILYNSGFFSHLEYRASDQGG